MVYENKEGLCCSSRRQVTENKEISFLFYSYNVEADFLFVNRLSQERMPYMVRDPGSSGYPEGNVWMIIR